jgi:hypothetical protein
MTLPEVLIGLALFSLAGVAGTTMLLRAMRFLHVERSRVALAATSDAALGFFGADLAEVAPGDLISAAPGAITYRAIRLDGQACVVSAGEVRIGQPRLRASRMPQAGRDSLFVLSQTDSGPIWVASGISSVSASQCGADPAIRLTGDSTALAGAALSASGATPVKTFEVMEARFYTSGGQHWLGARSVSAGEAIQPLAGPFEPGAGFQLRDSSGLPATVTSAWSLQLLLEARRPAWDRSPSGVLDTALTILSPRNLAP